MVNKDEYIKRVRGIIALMRPQAVIVIILWLYRYTMK